MEAGEKVSPGVHIKYHFLQPFYQESSSRAEKIRLAVGCHQLNSTSLKPTRPGPCLTWGAPEVPTLRTSFSPAEVTGGVEVEVPARCSTLQVENGILSTCWKDATDTPAGLLEMEVSFFSEEF